MHICSKVLQMASKVHAACFRNKTLILEHAISIAFKSGEYGGSKRRQAPRCATRLADEQFFLIK